MTFLVISAEIYHLDRSDGGGISRNKKWLKFVLVVDEVSPPTIRGTGVSLGFVRDSD